MHNEIIDKEGNYLILDITIQEYRITLVALYGPNNDSPNLFTNIQDIVVRILNTSIIMVGDWNVVQDYETDTANYRSQNNIKAQRQIIDMKNSLDLNRYLESNKSRYKKIYMEGPRFKTK